MTTFAHVEPRSERGIALVVVLLLMAVLSGLATGFAMNGQVESTMAQNEVYYAGARAAAEAGINRATTAIRLETVKHLLYGDDEVAGTADDGDLGFLLTGAAPYALDAAGQYSYSIEVLDDDDPALYNGTNLSDAQLTAMGNEGTGSPRVPDPGTDHNTRLVLRATGFGPSNTVVRLARVIISAPSLTEVDPAIIVDGDLNIGGNIHLEGVEGSVHANGNLTIDGNAADVSGDATASGDFTANQNFDAGGAEGGGYASINLPEIHASDYDSLADYTLNADGSITNAAGNPCSPCAGANGWSFSGGTWSISGNTVSSGTFYVKTSVTVSGSPSGNGNNPVALSIISEGSISITGSPRFTPENADNIQFVTDGDLLIGGNADLDAPTQVNGHILVREQIHIAGNPEFQGRIIVTDDDNVFNEVTTNAIPGTPTITYDGGLPPYTTTSYINNVRGWIEQ